MNHALATGTRIRKSPFFARTVAAGMTHVTVYNHMMMPTSYGDPEGEYWRLIEEVALWDVAVERQVELAGPDAAALAQALVPRDMAACRVGQGKYAPLCDHAGRLLNDPVLLKLADDRFWLSIADSDVLWWARAVAAERGLNVEVTEPDVSPLAIQGPKAEAVARDLFGDWVSSLKYFWFRETTLDGIPLVVARSGWSKQGGFELYLMDGAQGGALWDRVWEAGQPHGIGPGAPNPTERIESALLSYGSDTDDRTNPYEVRLGDYVDLSIKPDFIGKAALRRIAQEGPRRLQVGLFLEGEPIAGNQERWAVHDEGRSVGVVTAATRSPRLERNIALALIERESAAEATELTVETANGPRRAEVTSLPFC